MTKPGFVQQGTTPNLCVSAVPSVTSFPSLSNVMRPSAAKSVKEAEEEEQADYELERHVLDSTLVSLCRSDECCPWAQQVVHARYWSICLLPLGQI